MEKNPTRDEKAMNVFIHKFCCCLNDNFSTPIGIVLRQSMLIRTYLDFAKSNRVLALHESQAQSFFLPHNLQQVFFITVTYYFTLYFMCFYISSFFRLLLAKIFLSLFYDDYTSF